MEINELIDKLKKGNARFTSGTAERKPQDTSQRKLFTAAHEIGHVVAENYFEVSPPQNIHEVIAQYAEQHITD